MLKFYFNGSPNPTKVALFLEESGLPYEAIAVDTRNGDQFQPDYLKLNPNGKVPTIVDGETCVFDSNAILLYLAEKTGKFLPSPAARGELLSWLMFAATGVGPYSGQGVHFKHFAPEKIPYAIDRYLFEVRRHFHVLDSRLADRRYLVGGTYTIVDMDVWHDPLYPRRGWLGELSPSQAAARRDRRAAGGRARQGPQGSLRLQGDDGR